MTTPAAADEDERLARAGLCRLAEPGDVLLQREIAARGAAAAWERLRKIDPCVDPRRDLDNLAKLGGRLVCPGDAEWPDELDGLGSNVGPGESAAPYALWVRGRRSLSEAAERAVALVGSRAATSYGLHVGGDIALGLAESGWTVVSGAAFGIDGAAHRGALVGAGVTVAVLAGGVDVPYPKAHSALLQRIAEEGLVVSEAPPGTPPLRRRFLIRNRVIAGLSAGVLVVEAGLRSGALNTARQGRRLGRSVLAVPGPVTSGLSAGCHLLLRQWPEAQLVTNAAEVVESVGRIGELAAMPITQSGPRDDLEPLMHKVLDAVPSRTPKLPDEIAARCGESLDVVELVLQSLLAAGLAERRPEGFRLTELGRRPSAG